MRQFLGTLVGNPSVSGRSSGRAPALGQHSNVGEA